MKRAISISPTPQQNSRVWLDNNYKKLMACMAPPYSAYFAKGKKPSHEKLGELQSQLDNVEQNLAYNIESEDLAMILEILFSAFASKANANHEALAGAYIFALGDFSKYAIEQACQDFLKGLVPQQSLHYVPSPALFASHCRLLEQECQLKIRLMRSKLQLNEER